MERCAAAGPSGQHFEILRRPSPSSHRGELHRHLVVMVVEVPFSVAASPALSIRHSAMAIRPGGTVTWR